VLQHIELYITNLVTQLIQSYLGDKHIMNNQQTPPLQFSVRVGRKEFALKAFKAYTYYSKLYEQYSDEVEKCTDINSRCLNIGIMLNLESSINRLKTLISMVSDSPDEFVTVTEDIYKLIYKCDS